GRSAKISSGRGFPGHRISKKLMLRMRPGVELVLATLLPTRELITLDFPTLDRPRKAISGSPGGGKWRTSRADNKNRVRTRIAWTQPILLNLRASRWIRASSRCTVQRRNA